MAEKRPFMNREDVAKLIGATVKDKTVSTYLYESRPTVGKGPRQRKGRYADHPFPAPDGYQGKSPWWHKERRKEILAWAAERPGQGAGGGRPRSSG